MVDQLRSFASEVTRVAREVGTEGKLGGQARRRGRAGHVEGPDRQRELRWPSNLTGQVRNIADVTKAVANGDLSKKITVDVKGEILELKNTINTMVDQLRSFASEVTRVAREVGTEGKLGGQAEVKGVAGTWKDLTDSVNFDGEQPDRPGAQHRRRDDGGRDRRPVEEDHRRRQGRDPRAQEHDQHDGRPAALVRVGSDRASRARSAPKARSAGRPTCRGVAGTWKDLTESVNSMASNLTGQVRNIADVTKAVASGDLSKKITVDVKGEILELKNTINTMVDQLSLVRVGSDARGARGRHRRAPRRPGRRAGRGRHVEGPDRECQLDGEQPDRAGAQHRRRDDARSRPATCRRRSPST